MATQATCVQPAYEAVDDAANSASLLLAKCAWSMAHGQAIAIQYATGGPAIGVVNMVEREDGSGKCFNVRFTNGRTVFIRCRWN